MIIKLLDKSGNVLIENKEFDSRSFFNAPFVTFARKFKLVKLPDYFYITELGAIEKRLNYVVDRETKTKVLNHKNISHSDKIMLSLINNREKIELEVEHFLSIIQGKKYGNLEEIEPFIRDLIKENKNISNIIIER